MKINKANLQDRVFDRMKCRTVETKPVVRRKANDCLTSNWSSYMHSIWSRVPRRQEKKLLRFPHKNSNNSDTQNSITVKLLGKKMEEGNGATVLRWTSHQCVLPFRVNLVDKTLIWS